MPEPNKRNTVNTHYIQATDTRMKCGMTRIKARQSWTGPVLTPSLKLYSKNGHCFQWWVAEVKRSRSVGVDSGRSLNEFRK